MYELECLTAEQTAECMRRCVPDCPCQPDQRENECFPYFVSESEESHQ